MPHGDANDAEEEGDKQDGGAKAADAEAAEPTAPKRRRTVKQAEAVETAANISGNKGSNTGKRCKKKLGDPKGRVKAKPNGKATK